MPVPQHVCRVGYLRRFSLPEQGFLYRQPRSGMLCSNRKPGHNEPPFGIPQHPFGTHDLASLFLTKSETDTDLPNLRKTTKATLPTAQGKVFLIFYAQLLVIIKLKPLYLRNKTFSS